MSPIIFSTHKDGDYRDHWSSAIHQVGVSNDTAGIREMIYYGQNCGKRDGMIQPGTLVAVRPNRNARYFVIVGKILLKTCTREREKKIPAEYKLLIEIYSVPIKIDKDPADKFTHNAVLRSIGLPIEKGAVAQGIYG
jgi:hypothetical protein